MGWDEENAAYLRMKEEEDAERNRRESVGSPTPGGGTLLGPESGGQSFLKMIGDIGKFLGDRGWGGTMPVPPTPRILPPPEERTPSGPAEQWKQFVAMGGSQMKYKDGTSIKYNPPKSEAEKAQEKQIKGQGGVSPASAEQLMGQVPRVSGPGGPAQPQASPGQPLYSQMVPPVTAVPSEVEDAKLIAAQQAERAAQTALAERNVGNTPYSQLFRQGEVPLSPMDEYRQRREEGASERAERQGIIAKGTRSRGDLLAEQYSNIAASTGKGMRIVMSALNFINKGNPLWTDELAGLGADHEAARQAIIMDRSLSSAEKQHAINKDSIDRLVQRQTVQRAEALKELDERLRVEPERAQDKRYLRDYLISRLNMSEANVPQFLEDHFDKKTGKYNIVKSPYEEWEITTKNTANALMTLLPTLPFEIAVMGGKSFDTVLKYFSDKEAQAVYRVGIAKTEQERAVWDKRAEVAAGAKHALASNPKVQTVTYIADQIRQLKEKGQVVPDRLYSEHHEAYKAAYGASGERDPKKNYQEAYERELTLKSHLLQNEETAGRIAAQKAKSELPRNIVDSSLGSFPGKGEMFRDKKTSEKLKEDLYVFHTVVVDNALKGKIPKDNSDASQEQRNYIQHLRGHVNAEFAAYKNNDVRVNLGPLSDEEVAYMTNNIWSAQKDNTMPNFNFMADKIREVRAQSGKQSGKTKK